MSTSNDASRVEEVARFLARFAPFRDLDATRLRDVAEHAGSRSFSPGAEILHRSSEPADHLFVIHRGGVDVLDEAEVVEHLGPGETFGLSVFSGLGPMFTVRAREETECFLIDADRARALMGTPAGLASLAEHMARWRERDDVVRHVRRAGVDDRLPAEIAAAREPTALVEVSRLLPELVADLLARGTDPVDVGHVVGISIDRLTTRLIELFVEERGEPPAAFAWVALGSAARHEQALTTDQDHAVAYGDGSDPDAIDPYFTALAEAVTHGLEACGIERCRGNVMAVNPAWRRTKEAWHRRFEEYVADPDLMGARITGIAFDYRRVTGAVDIEATLDDVIRRAGRDRGFVRRLAMTALESGPPVGRHRDLAVKHRGEHAGRVDVKHEGITIVTNLARVYAIVAGLTENRTAERLRGAASAGTISDRTHDDLVEAFRLLWRIRLERHSELMARGEQADDLVDPTGLSPISQRALGGALRVIADAQEGLARDLGIPHHRR